MANTVKFLNDTGLDSFFQDTILDNNGIPVTDINAGLRNLFTQFNDYADTFEPTERYFVKDIDEGYPDLIAKHSILNSQDYWWWITLLNRLENPMTDFKLNWIYSINDSSQIESFINYTNETNSSNNRIGRVIELN